MEKFGRLETIFNYFLIDERQPPTQPFRVFQAENISESLTIHASAVPTAYGGQESLGRSVNVEATPGSRGRLKLRKFGLSGLHDGRLLRRGRRLGVLLGPGQLLSQCNRLVGRVTDNFDPCDIDLEGHE